MGRRDGGENPWKGLVLGGLGSVLGLLLMRLFQQKIGPMLMERLEDDQQDQSGNKQESPLDDISLVGQQHKEGEASTAAIGRIVYTQLTGNEPSSDELKSTLSYLVHWGYGLSQGALYGARRESSGLDLTRGVRHATLMWLLGDELMVPLLGLQGGPTAAPPVQHFNRLGAHLFYGIGTEVGTWMLEKLL